MKIPPKSNDVTVKLTREEQCSDVLFKEYKDKVTLTDSDFGGVKKLLDKYEISRVYLSRFCFLFHALKLTVGGKMREKRVLNKRQFFLPDREEYRKLESVIQELKRVNLVSITFSFVSPNNNIIKLTEEEILIGIRDCILKFYQRKEEKEDIDYLIGHKYSKVEREEIRMLNTLDVGFFTERIKSFLVGHFENLKSRRRRTDFNFDFYSLAGFKGKKNSFYKKKRANA